MRAGFSPFGNLILMTLSAQFSVHCVHPCLTLRQNFLEIWSSVSGIKEVLSRQIFLLWDLK